MGCWEMLFWLLIAGAVFELLSMVIRGWALTSALKQCRSLEEADRLVKEAVKTKE